MHFHLPEELSEHILMKTALIVLSIAFSASTRLDVSAALHFHWQIRFELEKNTEWRTVGAHPVENRSLAFSASVPRLTSPDPQKAATCGKSTFGQTNGLHLVVERRIYARVMYKKFEEKENKMKMKYKEIKSGTRERLWRLLSISSRRIAPKFPKFESIVGFNTLVCLFA
jgi:hypothetical protein